MKFRKGSQFPTRKYTYWNEESQQYELGVHNPLFDRNSQSQRIYPRRNDKKNDTSIELSYAVLTDSENTSQVDSNDRDISRKTSTYTHEELLKQSKLFELKLREKSDQRTRWKTDDPKFTDGCRNISSINILQAVNAVDLFIKKSRMKKAYQSEFLQLCRLLIDPMQRSFFPSTLSQLKHYTSLFKTPEAKKCHIVNHQIQEYDKRNVSKECTGNYYSFFDIGEVMQSNFDRTEFRLHLLEGIQNQNARDGTQSDWNYDIQDGRIHQQLREKGAFLHYSIHQSWSIFIDGVSLYSSGTESYLPCFLAINSLPRNKRFLVRNVILVGLMSSKHGKIDEFISILIQKLNLSFEQGFQVKLNGSYFTCRGMVTAIVMDLKEKAKIFKIKAAGAYFSCLLCYIRGVCITGKGIYYPYPRDLPEMNPRTQQTISIDTNIASCAVGKNNVTAFRGIMSPHLFKNLLGFKFPEYVRVDSMHVCESGVVKTLLLHWRDSILRRLKKTKVPSSFSRPFRSLDIVNNWKADEYKNFLLFASLPLITGKLHEALVQHWSYLLAGMRILKSKRMHKGVSYLADIYLSMFYQAIDRLYGTNLSTLKVHSLVHCGETARDYGLLDEVSSKKYEDLNGYITRATHGTTRAQDEMIENFNNLKYLSDRVSSLKLEFGEMPFDQEYYDLIDLLSTDHDWIAKLPSTWKKLNDNMVYCSSNSVPLHEHTRLKNLVSSVVHDETSFYEVVHRIHVNDVHYRSFHSNSGTIDDSRVIYEDQGSLWFGTVETFLKQNEKMICMLYCHGKVDRKCLAPTVTNVDHCVRNLRKIDSQKLRGVCIYMNIRAIHYMVPVDGDYMSWDPVKDWSVSYKTMPHSTVLKEQELITLIGKVQNESSNFTYKTNNLT